MQSTLDTMALRVTGRTGFMLPVARTATKPSSKPWSMQNGVAMLSHYLRQSLLLAILSLAPLTVAPAVAQSPQGWVQAGVLSCRLNPSIGFVIFGHQSMECRFSARRRSGARLRGSHQHRWPRPRESAMAAGLLGRSSARQRKFPTAHWQENMSGPPVISASELVQARTCLSAAPIAALPCSRFRWKGLLR